MSWLHPVFNVVKLLQAPKDPIPGRKAHPPPPPEMVDGEEHYIVEQVLDSCMGILSYSTLSGSSHYLVDIQLSTP